MSFCTPTTACVRSALLAFCWGAAGHRKEDLFSLSHVELGCCYPLAAWFASHVPHTVLIAPSFKIVFALPLPVSGVVASWGPLTIARPAASLSISRRGALPPRCPPRLQFE
eukprot:EG_transcript_48261